jgi:hypothetical protein
MTAACRARAAAAASTATMSATTKPVRSCARRADAADAWVGRAACCLAALRACVTARRRARACGCCMRWLGLPARSGARVRAACAMRWREAHGRLPLTHTHAHRMHVAAPRTDVRIFDLMKPLQDFPREKVAGYLESLDIWDLRCVLSPRAAADVRHSPPAPLQPRFLLAPRLRCCLGAHARTRAASCAAADALARATPRRSFKGQTRREASWNAATRVLPCLLWLQNYNVKEQLFRDIAAGVAVTFLIIPQGLSYAGIAGVPAIYGLCTHPRLSACASRSRFVVRCCADAAVLRLPLALRRYRLPAAHPLRCVVRATCAAPRALRCLARSHSFVRHPLSFDMRAPTLLRTLRLSARVQRCSRARSTCRSARWPSSAC